jgi:hypothetical protein
VSIVARLLPSALLAVVACGAGGGDTPDASETDATILSDAGDGGTGAPETSMSCLFCSDAAGDASVLVQVRGEVDRVCSNMDGCHGSGTGGMTLLPGSEFNAMINVTSFENPPMKRVLPGNPLQSYVYLKLWCDGGISGSCMPRGAPDPKTAELFGQWIEAGAPTQ